MTEKTLPPEITPEEVKRLLGHIDAHLITEILETGASMTELEEAAAFLRGETDVTGALEIPLTGRVRQVFDLVRRDEERFEEDR